MKKFFIGVKGIITHNEQVLILERNSGRVFWEAPGGRVDEGETFKDTLVRELQEELPGITNISIHELLGVSNENIEVEIGVGLALLYFKVNAALPNPIKLSEEHKSYQWIGMNDSLEHIASLELRKIISQSSAKCVFQ